jgi:hypothetical protein
LPVDQVHFISFEQPQINWPTQQYGLVHLADGFPIYGLNQLPPAPYDVRGFIYVSESPGSSLAVTERAVAKVARQEGGEAAIFTASRTSSDRAVVEAMEYKIIQFRTNALASVLERINVYLALNPDLTNHLNRQELEDLRGRISSHPEPRDR